jgi:prepilin-type N-terminal cleavage/methylation domain-containing protein
MKNLLNRKIRNKKGFTLAELLIVVAIIGVLVAISIPIFTGQLQKARFGTNQANARSALSAASADWLATDDTTKSTWAGDDGTGIAYYTYDCGTGDLTGTPTNTPTKTITGATEVKTGTEDKAKSASTISAWKLSDLEALGKTTYKKWYIGINASGQCVYVGYSAS